MTTETPEPQDTEAVPADAPAAAESADLSEDDTKGQEIHEPAPGGDEAGQEPDEPAGDA